MIFPLHVQSPDSGTQKYECSDYKGQFNPHDTSPDRMGIDLILSRLICGDREAQCGQMPAVAIPRIHSLPDAIHSVLSVCQLIQTIIDTASHRAALPGMISKISLPLVDTTLAPQIEDVHEHA